MKLFDPGVCYSHAAQMQDMQWRSFGLPFNNIVEHFHQLPDRRFATNEIVK
jgi:hypothetical protein